MNTENNLLFSALAGSAKTTTLVMVAETLPNIPILSIAFNKRIAEDMKSRLPSNVKASTINAIGHGVWGTALAKKLTLDTRKSYNILKDIVDKLPKSLKSQGYANFSDTLKMVGSAKLRGYVPDYAFRDTPRLCTSAEFYGSLEEEPEDLQTALVDQALIESIKLSYNGLIDFDDQVLMSTLFASGGFPKFPLVMVDEAQDLSPLNLAMVEKLVVKRIIAVGDRFQSIYLWRGADSTAMDKLKHKFNMCEMPLSISFRCPQRVVEKARFRAPTMQWRPNAPLGIVETLGAWSSASIPDHAAIICRTNAPLFKCALQLIRAGRGVKLIGSDLGPQLVKALKKLGPESMTQEETLKAIDKWEAERLRKSRAKAATSDKAACLRVFTEYGETLSAIVAYAEMLFATEGPIQLCTVHKAKGLEWSVVYLLNPQLIPSHWATTPEELEQEENIRYVAYTRAKSELYMVDLANLEAPQ